jgi:hypothetical protein
VGRRRAARCRRAAPWLLAARRGGPPSIPRAVATRDAAAADRQDLALGGAGAGSGWGGPRVVGGGL